MFVLDCHEFLHTELLLSYMYTYMLYAYVIRIFTDVYIYIYIYICVCICWLIPSQQLPASSDSFGRAEGDGSADESFCWGAQLEHSFCPTKNCSTVAHFHDQK